MKTIRRRYHHLKRQFSQRNNQRGGALAKPRKISGVGIAGYIMSMFLSGPAPSFASAGFKLGSQALKRMFNLCQ